MSGDELWFKAEEVPGFLAAARADKGVLLFVLTDLVRCTPLAPFVGVDARAGVRFALPGVAGEVGLSLRPVEPGGGGFRAVVEDMLDERVYRGVSREVWALSWSLDLMFLEGLGAKFRITNRWNG